MWLLRKFKHQSMLLHQRKYQSPTEEPRTVEVSTVSNHIDCDNSYYTITGKLIDRPGEVRTINGNRRVKKDNIITDKIGQVGLRSWGKIIEEISNGST